MGCFTPAYTQAHLQFCVSPRENNTALALIIAPPKEILSRASRPRTPASWGVSWGGGGYHVFSTWFWLIYLDSWQNFMVKDIGNFDFYGLWMIFIFCCNICICFNQHPWFFYINHLWEKQNRISPWNYLINDTGEMIFYGFWMIFWKSDGRTAEGYRGWNFWPDSVSRGGGRVVKTL